MPFPRYLLNLFIVFLASGLWHGASWTFVVWGALHGLFVVGEAWRERRRQPAEADDAPDSGMIDSVAPIGDTSRGGSRTTPTPDTSVSAPSSLRSVREGGTGGEGFRLLPLLQMLATFAAVCFAWIFFRANSFADAAHVITHLFTFQREGGLTDPFAAGLLASQTEFIMSLGLIGLLLLVDALDAKIGLNNLFQLSPAALRWAVYYGAVFAVLFSGLYGTGAQEFIYFQF